MGSSTRFGLHTVTLASDASPGQPSSRRAELSRVPSPALELHRHDLGLSLERLVDDARSAMRGWNWERGAFGQGRMELIVRDGLPKGCYEFQLTLSNRSRPDCAVFLPDKRPLVIDAKFPLEAVTAFRDAKGDDERKQAAARLRHDLGKHVGDIAGKYLIPGETHDLALMFVPSESVYADLYDGFDDIIQKAFRSRVVIVSPSLLMLAVQVIQQIQKDARMREAADKIHNEVGLLMDDLGRLRDRVNKLGTHFGQANEDVRQILISAEKVEKRGVRIRDVEFDGDEQPSADVLPGPGSRKLEAGE